MISYAQNFEDAILNRLFCNSRTGFYIDIGAHDPENLSVTKFFYDSGWSGINVEPVYSDYMKFVAQRPRDINLNKAAWFQRDIISLYIPENAPEGSSAHLEFAQRALENNSKLQEIMIEALPISEICAAYAPPIIDFIKIDVEGAEKEVLLGADFANNKPRLLCIEATQPYSNAALFNPDENAMWHSWEDIVLNAGYIFVYYDGLNRYYLRNEEAHLAKVFTLPISPFLDNIQTITDINKDSQLVCLKNTNEQLEVKRSEEQDSVKILTAERDTLFHEKEWYAARYPVLTAERDSLLCEKNLLIAQYERVIDEKNKLFFSITSQRALILSELSKEKESCQKLIDERDVLILDKELLTVQYESVIDEKNTSLSSMDSRQGLILNELSEVKEHCQKLIDERNALFLEKEWHAVQHSNLTKERAALISERDKYFEQCKILDRLDFEYSRQKENYSLLLAIVRENKSPLTNVSFIYKLKQMFLHNDAYNELATKFNTAHNKLLEMQQELDKQNTFALKEKYQTPALGNSVFQWSIAQYISSSKKTFLVHIPDSAQRLYALQFQFVSGLELLQVHTKDFPSSSLWELERKQLENDGILYDFMNNNITHVNVNELEEAQVYLNGNIAFAHYNDQELSGLIDFCKITCTPLCINRTLVVESQLGKDYPLYYTSYANACAILQDKQRIISTHLYLIDKNVH